MRQLSEIAKTQIIGKPLHSIGEKEAFLSAYFRVAGFLSFSNRTKQYGIRADFLDGLQDFLTNLLLKIDEFAFEYDMQNGAMIFKGASLDELLDILRIFVLDKNSGEINYVQNLHRDFSKTTKVALASLKGFFVGAGSISVASGYHLEFNFSNGFLADDCLTLLSKFDIDAKKIERQSKFVVYLKKAESITDVLTLLGADDAALRVLDQSAARESKLLVQRRVNCDLKNISKQIDAAAPQLSAITFLIEQNALKKLDKKLIDTAFARLEHPDAPLAEFASILGISKTGARHRLDKLVAAANANSAHNAQRTAHNE